MNNRSPKSRRLRRCLIAGLITTPILAGLLAFVLSGIVSSQRVRESIQRAASGTLNARVGFGELKFVLLPRPHLAAAQVRIETGRGEARLPLLRVYPRIAPLLAGEIEISRLDIEGPSVSADLTAFEPAGAPSPGTGFEIAALPGHLARRLPKLPAVSGIMRIFISDGGIEIRSAAENDVLRIRNLNAELTLRGRAVNLSASFDSDPAPDLRLETRLDGDAGTAEARLHAPRLRPEIMLPLFPDEPPTDIAGSPVDLEITARVRPGGLLDTSIRLEAEEIRVVRKGRKAVYSGLRAEGSLSHTQGGMKLALRRLKTGKPLFDLNGSLRFDPSGRLLELNLGARRADLSAVADPLRMWAPGDERVNGIFSVIPRGMLSDFRLSAEKTGTPPGFGLKGLRAAGTLDEGTLVSPVGNMTFRKVRGAFHVDDGMLLLENVRGELADSRISETRVEMDLRSRDMPIRVRSHIDADLRRLIEIADALPLPRAADEALSRIREIRGRATGSLDLDGPIHAPSVGFDLEASGIVLDHPDLPGPLSLKSGGIALTENGFSFRRLEAGLLDAALSVSGRVGGTPSAPAGFDLRFDGRIGEAFLAYLDSVGPFPEAFKPKPPLELSGLTVARSDGGPIHVSGSLKAPGGPALRLDIASGPGMIRIDRLEVIDKDEKGLFRGRIDRETVEASFRGSLNQHALDGFLVRPDDARRSLKGDIRFVSRRTPPFGVRLEGRLEAVNIPVPTPGGPPALVRALTVESEEGGARVRLTLRAAGSDLSAEGTIAPDDRGLRIDLDVTSPEIDLAGLAGLLPEEPEPGHETSGDTPDPGGGTRTPLAGTIRVRAAKARYDAWWIAPLEGIIELDDTSRIRITKAGICGILVTGDILRKQGRTSALSLELSSSGQDLQETYRCLRRQDAVLAGTFDLKGEIRASAGDGPIRKSMQGRLRLLSKDGRIHNLPFLSKLFAVLNITELLLGKRLGTDESGLPYDELRFDARLAGNELILDDIFLSGPTLKMLGDGKIDLDSLETRGEFLVSPIRTLDAAVGLIPFVGQALAEGNILSAGVRVSGYLNDPVFLPVPPSMVGGGLIGTMKKLLKTPFTILEPPQEQTP